MMLKIDRDLELWAECNDGHTVFSGENDDQSEVGRIMALAGKYRLTGRLDGPLKEDQWAMSKYVVTNGKGEYYAQQGDDYDYGAWRKFAKKFDSREAAEQVAEQGNGFNVLFGAPDAKTHPYRVVEVRDEAN